MPLGIGFAPIGGSLFGFGTPDSAAPFGNAILVEPTSGIPRDCRRIDARSRQYTFAANGSSDGMSGVQQRVLLAIATVRGSSALGAFGKAQGPQKHSAAAAKQVDADIRLALKDLVDAKVIEIVDTNPQDFSAIGVTDVVRFRDLTTGLEQLVTF